MSNNYMQHSKSFDTNYNTGEICFLFILVFYTLPNITQDIFHERA